MSTLLLGLADVLVAVLLVATIATSVKLSRRIASMKADEGVMRQQIGELVQATERAERAVAGLRETVAEGERTLAARIREAEGERAALDAAAQGARHAVGKMDAIAAIGRKMADGGVPPPLVQPARVVAPDPIPAATPVPTPRSPSGGSEALRAAVAAAEAIAERAARRSAA